MEKAVAVPYVIALILGVVVVGIVGYWFVSQGGKAVGAGTKAECDGKTQNYCQFWKNNFRFDLANRPTGFSWGSSCPEPERSNCVALLGCKFGGDICGAGEICFDPFGKICTTSCLISCPK